MAGEAPLGYTEPGDDVVVQYDEDVLRSLEEPDVHISVRPRLTKAQVEEMIDTATVDAYGESEQITGWFTMIDENLAVPFQTTVFGVLVTVEGVALNGTEQIVAVCARGPDHQALPILDLPLPTPPPDGAEWIEAYRHWRG